MLSGLFRIAFKNLWSFTTAAGRRAAQRAMNKITLPRVESNSHNKLFKLFRSGFPNIWIWAGKFHLISYLNQWELLRSVPPKWEALRRVSQLSCGGRRKSKLSGTSLKLLLQEDNFLNFHTKLCEPTTKRNSLLIMQFPLLKTVYKAGLVAVIVS